MLVADGMPLIWASRLQRTPLPERVCGSNLIWSLSEAAAGAGLSIYLLGGADDTAEQAGRILTSHFANLRIAGTYYPPYGFEKDPAELARMSEAIERAAPDIVFVALGFPKGERLIDHLRRHRPQAWWIGVGISFSFVCGHVSRAPKWMQRTGLEWLHRLLKEPRRLIKRYLIDDIPFAFRLLWRSFGERRQGGPSGR
jgi:N-acetylglucosaminyldiphosphoundecaprenol N-acetyl-beta-D-mannosaminyltransferase